ncbi:hypothetical protein PILCRDRAFT_5163 [Piloderma croceum F 1598]|uniref:Condensin complex subunit 1 C-terminal domain-containing protein n=1 Tax=Piloderma croceum (strain F 1598) TaxID=765440 RepID=A0A0C3BIH5_PILCF|nr:hypothetical protein PILCRDRAFT_5163 [Piloderma croceum F 1598]
MAEQAIDTICALGEHPDELGNTIIKNLTRRAPAREKDVGDAFELSRQLLFIVGHVAIKYIVFLELVEREWKRQKDEKNCWPQQIAPTELRKTARSLIGWLGMPRTRLETGLRACEETELLYGPESLLAIYGPMLVYVCGSPHKFKNRTLRAAATLSFSKFLCVSSQFCDQHHRLLFKILENIRSNIVIALGDVAVSFSNIVDENSNKLYKGLSDGDLVGQLGEMAKCLEDPEPRIAVLAKLFFTELLTKENARQLTHTVISHLSIGDHAVDEETFQSTMRYIFSFIEKEKQVENISERSVKKLIEGLQFYRDKLHEETVFTRFTEILAKARSNKSANKPDTKLNEFEAVLEDKAQKIKR